MKYENAKDVLPQELFEEVQKYASGRLLYFPIVGQRCPWGTKMNLDEILKLYQDAAPVAVEKTFGLDEQQAWGEYYYMSNYHVSFPERELMVYIHQYPFTTPERIRNVIHSMQVIGKEYTWTEDELVALPLLYKLMLFGRPYYYDTLFDLMDDHEKLKEMPEFILTQLTAGDEIDFREVLGGADK